MNTDLLELTKTAMQAIIQASYDDEERLPFPEYSTQVAERAVMLALKTVKEHARLVDALNKSEQNKQ